MNPHTVFTARGSWGKVVFVVFSATELCYNDKKNMTAADGQGLKISSCTALSGLTGAPECEPHQLNLGYILSIDEEVEKKNT